MSPARKRLRVFAAIAIVSLMSVGSIAVGQAQKLQESPQETPIVSSKLNLTMEQRRTIKENIKALKIANEPRNIQIRVG